MAKITVEAKPDEIKISETSEITATVKDDAGQPVAGQQVTFTVDEGAKGEVSPKQKNTDAGGEAITKLTPKLAAKGATITVTAKANGVEDKKEIKIMAATLDEKLAELKKKKEDLQTQKAATAEMEGQVQTLQDAIEVLAKVASLPEEIATMVKDYLKRHKGIEAKASDIKTELQSLEESIKADSKIADQLKAIQEKHNKVYKDIGEKKDKVSKLDQESEQLNKAVVDAEEEVAKQQEMYKNTKKAAADVDKDLKGLDNKIKDMAQDYKDNKETAQMTYFRILEFKNKFEEVNSILVNPDTLKKKLEAEWKALEAANQKFTQAKLKAAEKEVELVAAKRAHEKAEDKANLAKIIKEFIDSLRGA